MDDFKQELNKIFDHLRDEMMSLRTGRATPALIEDLEVEYYGSKTPLKAIAAISAPEPRQLAIQPWDKQAIPDIERAIQASQLGLNPIAEGNMIRISIPPLTEERRKDMVRMLGKHVEAARIRVRQERDEALKREVQGNDDAGEDEKFRLKNEIQKLTDETNEKIETGAKAKETEILTV